MKVERWAAYDEAEHMPEAPLSGLGGWVKGHSFADYLENIPVECHVYAIAFRDAVVERGLKETGFWHQNAEDGVPVYTDGTVSLVSMRAWGDIMAAVANGDAQGVHCYLDFYC